MNTSKIRNCIGIGVLSLITLIAIGATTLGSLDRSTQADSIWGFVQITPPSGEGTTPPDQTPVQPRDSIWG
ncbi:hypothetical protein [Streptomyces sp. NPDC059761]|uniref:hypothetical protein n=1 Tax=Streptomyces sp. NPDC059761 TaxID=3346937 RepID=UPI00366192BD